MIATALSMAGTSAWVCAGAAAVIGMAYNARPIAKLIHGEPEMLLGWRVGLYILGLMIMAYLWALMGIAASPVVALAAAWVSWSF